MTGGCFDFGCEFICDSRFLCIYELYDHLDREQQLKDNIAKVQADGAQLIVVIFHLGNETETVPDSNQTTLGRMAIDLGADLVCGHHPHVLQGIETYFSSYQSDYYPKYHPPKNLYLKNFHLKYLIQMSW